MSRVLVQVTHLLSWLLVRFGVQRSIRVGRWFGLFAFYCVPIRRKIVFENLRRAFPEKSEGERREIARKVYRQLGRVLVEMLMLPRLTDKQISGLVRLRNAHLLEAALSSGTGAIFCLGHMGNWELLGAEGHRRGYEVYAVTRKLKGALNQQIHEARKAVFKELPSRGSFEHGLDALVRSAALALVVDQHQSGDRAVIVDFFGRPAATSPSPALFHLRTGAPVLTGWMCLGPDDNYDVWINGPYAVPPAATLNERIQLHTQWLARDLESFIREHPAEWYWVHRRWKVPEGGAAVTMASSAAVAALPEHAREEAA